MNAGLKKIHANKSIMLDRLVFGRRFMTLVMIAFSSFNVIKLVVQGSVAHDDARYRHSRPDANSIALDSIVPTPGGYSLQNMYLSKSSYLDFRGNHYYLFTFDPAIDIHVSAALIKDGVWDNRINDLFALILKEEGNKENYPVLDVGANLGAFSFFVASLHCHVVSFEMQPTIFQYLLMSRQMNNYQHLMTVNNVALWNLSGVPVTFTPLMGNFGGTSIMPQRNVEEKNSLLRYVKPPKNNGNPSKNSRKIKYSDEQIASFKKNDVKNITVLTHRIDELFHGPGVFFMKIDVEGSEEFVLKGMGKLLTAKLVKHFVMEYDDRDFRMIRWLYEIGYVCGSYDRVMFEGPDFIPKHAVDLYCRVRRSMLFPY